MSKAYPRSCLLLGQNDAVYRFPLVTANVDALVKIKGRSHQDVELVSIDLSTVGHDKAFQPKVTYSKGSTPNGISDWWMEFEFSFVKNNTNTLVNVSSFDVTALDIDGNGAKLNEWVSFYGLKSYLLESATALSTSNVVENILSVLTVVGTKFTGPVTNFGDIDTSATSVMTTNKYVDVNTFKVRTGGHSTGSTGAADRMYSFWFKSFTYNAPVLSFLPATLIDWNAKLVDKNAVLSWTTTMEKNLRHFVIERSVNGIDYTDAAILFSEGNSDVKKLYSFTDKLPASAHGILYYRLKVMDMDGQYKYADVRIIRIGKQQEKASILTYPNPAVNEIRITVPDSWQGKKTVFEVYNTSGQLMRSRMNNATSQTEIMNIADLPLGIYTVKAFSEKEIAVQRFVKIK